MAVIDFSQFKGALPKYDPEKLPALNATEAQNCRFDEGDIRPLFQRGASLATAIAGVKTIFRHYSAFLQWNTRVDAVRVPIADDAFDRVAWTDGTKPKVTDASIATTAAPYPTNSYSLCIENPSVPTVAIGGTPTDGLSEDRVYVITYVNGYGLEGPPSDVSSLITVEPGETVTVTMPTAPADANANIVNKRIYRSATGSTDSTFLFVAEVALATATYVDSLDTDNLSEALQTINYDQLPDDAEGLTVMPNGVLVAFKGKDIYVSEPGQPHAYPIEYRKSTDYNIQAIGVIGTSAIIATDGNPYVLSGVEPSAMALDKLDMFAPCLAPESLVDMGEMVVWASRKGLAMVSAQGSAVLDDIWSQAEWTALSPADYTATYWDGLYLAFNRSTGVGFYMNPADQTEGVVTHNFAIDAACVDPSDGTTYVADAGGDITLWDDQSGTETSWYWTSKIVRLPKPTSLTAYRFDSDGSPGDLAFAMYTNGTAVVAGVGSPVYANGDVTDYAPGRLPGDDLYEQVQISIGNDVPVAVALEETVIPTPEFQEAPVSIFATMILALVDNTAAATLTVTSGLNLSPVGLMDVDFYWNASQVSVGNVITQDHDTNPHIDTADVTGQLLNGVNNFEYRIIFHQNVNTYTVSEVKLNYSISGSGTTAKRVRRIQLASTMDELAAA